MGTKTYIQKILFEISSELNKTENMNIIRGDILNPIIYQILDELQPYFLKFIILIISVFIFLLITVILNLRIIMYKH